MKKIITAMGNEKLNKRLKEEDNFQVMTTDIQYKEGILEFLEQNQNIDFLILNELLQGEINLKELIQKIKMVNSNIQIILFLENENQELENYLYAKGICYIFYNNQIKISEIIELIQNERQDSNQQLKTELEELKHLLLEKERSENKSVEDKSLLNTFFSRLKKKKHVEYSYQKENNLKEGTNPDEGTSLKKEKKSKIKEHMPEIICVSGTSGVGKSIFSINLAKSFMENRKKILIIDFDILNNSLHTILGIKKYPEKVRNKIKNNNLLEELQIEDLIMRVNSKIDLISGINLLFDSKYKISSMKVKNILLKLKEKYEVIIIDSSSECFFDYTREMMKNSNINIFITEANIADLKKAKKLLNIYINEWNIPQSNFNILFNKYNENSIDISILKNIFSGFSILGKLSVSPQYNLLINKGDTKSLEKGLKKEYLKINQKLLAQNKT